MKATGLQLWAAKYRSTARGYISEAHIPAADFEDAVKKATALTTAEDGPGFARLKEVVSVGQTDSYVWIVED
jgi:hypothetical protein